MRHCNEPVNTFFLFTLNNIALKTELSSIHLNLNIYVI